MDENPYQPIIRAELEFNQLCEGFQDFVTRLNAISEHAKSFIPGEKTKTRFAFRLFGRDFVLGWTVMTDAWWARLTLYEKKQIDPTDRYDEIESILFKRDGNAAPFVDGTDRVKWLWSFRNDFPTILTHLLGLRSTT